MTSKLPPGTRDGIVKRFRELGWEGPVKGTKHDYMVRGQQQVRLPNKHGKDIDVSLLRKILKQAGISRAEWMGRN